jgi:LysR family transcriptional activator of mexEF-oprN operon
LVEGCALRAEDPPFPIDAAQLSMAWSGVHDNDPAEKWLRSRISQFMSAALDIEQK